MKLRKRRVLTAVAGLFIIAGLALAAGRVYNFKGGVKTRPDKGLTKQELAPMPDTSGFYSWCYTFMFYLDDDSSAMIQLTYWKLYLLSQHGLLFAFYDGNGKSHLQKGIIDSKDFSYQKDPPELRMGANYWRGFYPDFYVHIDLPASEDRPAMKADVHFKCKTPGWRPGEGPVHYGEPDGDWYDLIVIIPWADVSGTVTIGGKTRKIKGWGYSDHNTQTVFPTTQSDELFALRSFSDDYAINFLEYIAPEDLGRVRSTWIIIIKDNRILYATDQWERKFSDFRTEKKRGYKYPTMAEISIDQPDCKLTGKLRADNFIGSTDAMDELPSFIRPMAEKFVTAPVFIRQNATVDYHLVMPKEGIDDTFQSKGVFEATIVK